MRLEVRNDVTVACPHCGTHEPVLIGGFGEPLAADLSALVEAEWGRREVELRRLLGEESAVRERALVRVNGQVLGLVDAVGALVGSRPRWFRFWKRRWYGRLCEAAVVALRDVTTNGGGTMGKQESREQQVGPIASRRDPRPLSAVDPLELAGAAPGPPRKNVSDKPPQVESTGDASDLLAQARVAK